MTDDTSIKTVFDYENDQLTYKRQSLGKYINKHEFLMQKFANGQLDSPREFLSIPISQKIEVVAWIVSSFTSIKGINHQHSSYGYKHMFESSIFGFYMSNAEFKGALIIAGFRPDEKAIALNQINWDFNISEQSVTHIQSINRAIRDLKFSNNI